MLAEFLGPLFNDHGLQQRSEGGQDAKQEMAATSAVSTEERPLLYFIARSKSQILSTLKERGLHSGVSTRRQRSLGGPTRICPLQILYNVPSIPY